MLYCVICIDENTRVGNALGDIVDFA